MERRFVGPKRVLVVAGSDSSGGAGLEADQKVIAAHGCYAMTATTALTAQNTLGVSNIHHIPPDFVVNQMDQCIDDIGVDVVKIGMLASAPTVDAVAEALERYKCPPTVLDPVMVSTSGAQLLPDSAISSLLNHLVPLATILTPNIPEAKLLLQHANISTPNISSLPDLLNLAKLIHSLGPQNVLLKGGHFPLPRSDPKPNTAISSQQVVTDILISSSTSPNPDSKAEPKATIFQSAYISTRNTHGTGCSLASAIACNLALGHDITTAVANSAHFIEGAIGAAKGWQLGKGSGPIDHFFASRAMQNGRKGLAEREQRERSAVVQWEWEGDGDAGC